MIKLGFFCTKKQTKPKNFYPKPFGKTTKKYGIPNLHKNTILLTKAAKLMRHKNTKDVEA
jgi:hypothetical protein